MGVCSGSGVGSGGGDGARSGIFFLPPITPSPFLGFFGGSCAAGSGTASLGRGEAVGVRLRGGDESSGSRSVASFVGTTWGCGDMLLFLGFGLGGEMADLVSCALCRGTTSCCWGFSEFVYVWCYRGSVVCRTYLKLIDLASRGCLVAI